jgi:twitching motility protein PilT
MQLLDDALFNLWQSGMCEERDVVMRSNNPGDLKAKIARAKAGLLGDEDEDDDDDDADEG